MILEIFTTWKILGIVALVLAVIFFKGRNAVWGALTGGVLIGIIAAFFREGKFDWFFVSKFAIVGILLGVAAELLGKISDRSKQKRNNSS